MARTYNPYASQYEGAIRAAGELGQQFLKSTNPAAGIEAEALGWQANRDRQSVIDAQRERGILEDAYQQVRQTGPEAFGGGSAGRLFQTLLGSAAGRGDYDDLGEANLAVGGAMPEVSDDRLGRLFVGAGNAIGQEDALSLPDRESVRGAIQQDTLQQDRQQQQADYQRAMAQESMQQAGKDRRMRPGDIEELAAWGAGGYPVPEDAQPMSQEGYLFHRYGNVDEGGAPVDSGSGGASGPDGAGEPYGLTPDQNRWLGAQDDLGDTLSSFLAESGVPTDDENKLRTELLPPGYYDQVLETAAAAAKADNFSRPKSYYVQNALFSQPEVPTDYTEDDIPIWGFGDEKLTMGAPAQQPDPGFQQLMDRGEPAAPQGGGRPQQGGGRPQQGGGQPQQGGGQPQQGGLPVVVSDEDYEALPPGTMFQDENGQQYRKPAE